MNDINPLILVNEEALKAGRLMQTKQTLGEELRLLTIAVSQLDISNLLSGAHTNTSLMKIKLCEEIINLNHEKLNEKLMSRMFKKLYKMNSIIDRKLRYGKKVDKYLEKKEDNILYILRTNLIEEELKDYEVIRTKLHDFKDLLVKKCEELNKIYNRL